MKVDRRLTYRAPLQRRLDLYSENLANGCVVWRGAIRKDGYGHFGVGDKIKLVHRVAYELKFGAIPAGKILDHLCRNRACINPEHLEPVTYRENILRGIAPHVLLHHTGRCAKGHEMTRQPSGRMSCKTCNRASTKRYLERKRVAA